MTTPIVRLGIRVRADRAEVALAGLFPILQAGAEEREVGGDVEYALYAPAGELPALEDIRALAGDALVDVVSEPVADGWERRWHEFLRPVQVGSLVVRAPWASGGPDDLVIDPGIYFGAGARPTTRMCLELLLGTQAGGALCDWAPARASWRWRRRGAARAGDRSRGRPGRARGDRSRRGAERCRGHRVVARPQCRARAVGAGDHREPDARLLFAAAAVIERPPDGCSPPDADWRGRRG